VSEEKDRMRMEPEEEKEQDVEGHQLPGQEVPRQDDDDVEAHEFTPEVTPEITP